MVAGSCRLMLGDICRTKNLLVGHKQIETYCHNQHISKGETFMLETHFLLATGGCQTFTNQCLGLCDYSLL